MKSPMILRLLTISVCWSFSLTCDVCADLVAEVRTSAGNFSINLNYNGARRTVSNFIRLATGEQPWLDEKSGKIQYNRPFYNGLKFYKKVSTGSVAPRYVQAGARYPGDPFVFTADVKQGAGYILRDEMTTGLLGLNVPHGMWTVTMANTGPHSSSSQFLINLIGDQSYNGRNSAFGTVLQRFTDYNTTPPTVTNGRAVVSAIHASASNVTIYNVTFRIIGGIPASISSILNLGELPSLGTPQITSVTHTPTEALLGYAAMQATELRMYASSDLFTWYYIPSGNSYLRGEVLTNPPIATLHGGFPQAFYRLSSATYPVHSVPTNFLGKTILMYIKNWYSSGGSTPPYLSLRFGPSGITNEYLVAGSSSWQPLTFDFVPKGPFHGDMILTSPALAGRTLRLFFGGAQQKEDSDPALLIKHARKPAIDMLTGEPDVEVHYMVISP